MATKSRGSKIIFMPSGSAHLSIPLRNSPSKDEVTAEDKHDTNSDEASADDVEQFPLILEGTGVTPGESPEVPRADRRKSFLGGLAPRRKSFTEQKLQTVSLEDMTLKINAKQLALCLKELKEGTSENVSFEGIKLSPRELKKITSLVKKAHKAHQKNKNERRLKSLNMHNCGIDDNMCDLIADMILAVGIGMDEFLTDINLSNNDITTKGALLILGAIKQNHNVTSLSLKGNDIADGVSRWLDEQIQLNNSVMEKGKGSPEMKRFGSGSVRIKSRAKKESPPNSFDEKEKGITQAAVDNLRMEYEKLNAQVHALRAEIKKLEAKRSKLKKKDSKEKATTPEDTERDKIFDDSIFKLVDSTKVRIGRRVAPLGGSGASIFEAEVDGWTCALKEIIDLKYMNNATINSFEREIKILASLPAHPNVCRYLFASREDNVLRLFMSLYHGTVASVIRNRTNVARTDRHNSHSSLSRLFSVISSNSAPVISPSSLVIGNGHHSPGSETGSDSSWATDSSGASTPVTVSPRNPQPSPRSPRGETTTKMLSPRSLASRERTRSRSYNPTIEKQYFTPKQVHFYALEIASGLEFLHSHGIIHRDIKCENIFTILDMEGNIKSLAIGDFDTALNTLLAKPRTVCGTTAFMAPEVFRGQDYSQLADVFSFGVVLYTLLTLELPWGQGVTVVNYEDRLARGVEYPYRILEAFGPLTKLCTSCLSMNPADRPTAKTVRDMLRDMEI